jgi:hypothetical protein
MSSLINIIYFYYLIVRHRSTNAELSNCNPENIDLEKGLQNLVEAGLLSPINRMSITELLNPEDETPVIDRVLSAEEIVEQLNTADEEAEAEPDPEPLPTAAESYKAASVLIARIEGTGDMEGLDLDRLLQKYLTKLESEVSFGNKKQPSITDFFN